MTPEDDAAPAADAPAEVETPAPAGSNAPTSGVPAAGAPASSTPRCGETCPATTWTAFVRRSSTLTRRNRRAGAAGLPRGSGDSYGVRVRGYLVPPESGDYRFFISADDHGALSLSTAPTRPTRSSLPTRRLNSTEVYDKYPEQAAGPLHAASQHTLLLRGALQTGRRQGQSLRGVGTTGGEREVIDTRYIEPVE